MRALSICNGGVVRPGILLGSKRSRMSRNLDKGGGKVRRRA